MTRVRARMTHRLTRERVMLEIRRARKPFAVMVTLGVLAFAALAYLVGNLRGSLPWEDPYTARVAVDDASGVIAGKQEVRISGVAVGRIAKVTLDGERPVLSIEIDREHGRLYRSARLRLRPRTPLDDLYLDVESRGTARAGALGDQTLQAARTRTPVDVGRVLDAFDADTRGRVKIAIDELGHALPDRGEQLRAALAEVAPFLRAAQRLTGPLAARPRQTRRLVHNLRLMAEELGGRQRALATLVHGASGTFAELAAADAPLAATISELPPTLHRLQSSFATVRATADRLDPALDALGPTAAALPAGLDGLRQLSRSALPALQELGPPVRNLVPLVTELRPTARNLDQAFASLRPQAPRLDRVTAQVVPCELALQKFLHNTLSVTKFGTRTAAFPRGHIIGGLSSAGGLVNDPAQRAGSSCAKGGPNK